jgi:hypothetical protein
MRPCLNAYEEDCGDGSIINVEKYKRNNVEN